MYLKGLLLGATLFLVTCGSSPKVEINVDVGVNDPLGGDPFNAYAATNGALGIHFKFIRLKCHPPGGGPINVFDQVSATPDLEYPPAGEPGEIDPQNEYKINTSGLDVASYYRVEMVGPVGSANDESFKGVGDCPINLSLGNANVTTVCFGRSSPTPLCPSSLGFPQCPSMAADQVAKVCP